jgi:XTP/dITP diphosphohydrolase
MNKLLLATNNQGKVHEYQDLLKCLPLELVTPASIGIKLDVAESGSTYQDNARLKAEAFAKASNLLTLADDSGLEVDALHGEPGIRSSRYAGQGSSDADRVRYLLSRLKDVPDEQRTARFRCVIALVWPDGKIEYCSGVCEGIITREPRGKEGFGYDPIFYFPGFQKTMAELSMDVKNNISHRALAAKEACELLNKTCF